jgi:hypothetical protein
MFFCDAVDDDASDRSCDGVSNNRPENRPPDPAVVAATAGRVVPPHRIPRTRRSARRRAHRVRAPPDDDDAADAYSIAQFCKRHAISQSFYFALQAAGQGPRTMKVGGRVLISKEAARAWRKRREGAARRKG